MYYPIPSHPDAHKKWWTLACVLLVIPISLFAMMNFIFSSDFLGMDERAPKVMMEGIALKPHVYRQFIPALARGILAITPDSAEEEINAGLSVALWGNKLFSEAVSQRHRYGKPLELEDDRLYAFMVISLLDYAFLLAYAYMLWLLARQLFPDLFSIHIMAPVFGLLALPPFCGKYGYIYDFPLLFFSAWLMLLIVRERWIAYCVVFAVATFNKETTAYFILLFILYGMRQLPRGKWVFYVAVQIMIFAMIKMLLSLVYEGSGGAMLEYRGLFKHLRFNLDGYSVYTLMGLAGALALFSYRWEEKPVMLRCWLGVLPFMIVAWLLFGNRNEYRVFYDIFPALTLLSCHTFATALQWRRSTRNTLTVSSP